MSSSISERYSVASDEDSKVSCLSWDASRNVFLQANDVGEVFSVGASGSELRKEASDEGITCLAIHPSGSSCVLGIGENLSQRELPNVKDELKMLARKELSITHTAYDSEGHNIFMSSLASGIDIFPSKEGAHQTINPIKTGDTGVRTFALNHNDSHIGVVDLHGKVMIIHMIAIVEPTGKTYSTCDVEGIFSGLVQQKIAMHAGDSVDMGCRLSWSRSNILAVPSSGGACVLCVKNKNTEKWNEVNLCGGDADGELSHGEVDLNIACFSPDDKHLATADMCGKILVWELVDGDLKNSKPVRCYTSENGTPLLDLVWGQGLSDNYLMVSSSVASQKLEKVVLPRQDLVESTPAETADEAVTTAAAPVARGTTATTAVAAVDDGPRRLVKHRSANDDDDDDDEDDAFAEEVPDATETANMDSITAIKQASMGTVVLGDDDEVMNEDGDIAEEWEENKAIPEISDIDVRLTALEEAKNNATMSIQKPFQPSSTRPDDKARRYLVWNSIGNITLRHEADIRQNQNRIEIRFSDALGRNKQEAFVDTDGFVMAALSKEGAIFATPCELLDEETAAYRAPLGSKIHYHHFPAQTRMNGANETFTLDLNESEEALNVAVGTGWCAVTTSKGLLRIFSSTGVQTHVYWLKGPAVTLCGFGSQLAIFYNSSQPMNGTVQLKMDLYSLDWSNSSVLCNRCLAEELPVPLSTGSTLEWVGFESYNHCVSILDTSGMLSVLMKPLSWQWVPVLDVETVKKRDHKYWPVMIRKDKFAYVLLNGESRPAIYPQPVVATKALRIPVAETREGKEKAAINQRAHDLVFAQASVSHYDALRNERGLFNHQDASMSEDDMEKLFNAQQIEADKTVLKMFQDGCRKKQTAKASELVYRLRTEKALMAAKQVANKFGMPDVAAKAERLLGSMEEIRLQGVAAMHEKVYEEFNAPPAPVNCSPAPETNTETSGYNMTNENAYQDDQVVSANIDAPNSGDRPVNRFKKVHQSPIKRKAGDYDMEDLKKMKASPSPSKKPLISM